MTKKKSRRRKKRTGKVLWLIAGILGAIIFSVVVYMLILAKPGNNLTKPENNLAKPDELLLTYMD